MSFFHLHILSDAAVAHLKDGGHEIETVALNELDKAIAAAKQTSLGATVAAAIKEAENTTDTGPRSWSRCWG